MNIFRTTRALIAASACLIAPSFTNAATISISDLTEGTPTLTLSGFPAGTGAAVCFPSPAESLRCTVIYVDSAAPAERVQFNEILLYEDAALSRLSDQFRLNHDTRASSAPSGSVFLDILFESDTEGILSLIPLDPANPPVQTPFAVKETGQRQSFAFNSFCPGCIDITVVLTSDAEVPAPATLALVGLGLAGLGFSRRKKA